MTDLSSNTPWQSDSVQENEWISNVLARHGRQASALALRMVGHLRDAEDVLQESLLKLLRKARKKPVHNPGAYLHAVVRTTALDVLAKRQAERLSKEALRDRHMCSRQTDPPSMLHDHEPSARLKRAIAQLQPRQAEVVMRRGLWEQSYGKIAEEMDISLNTARVYYWRGLRELQDIFFVE